MSLARGGKSLAAAPSLMGSRLQEFLELHARSDERSLLNVHLPHPEIKGHMLAPVAANQLRTKAIAHR